MAEAAVYPVRGRERDLGRMPADSRDRAGTGMHCAG